jgi:SIR2-like domain
MPLMKDWSSALSEALDAHESGLARACHLAPDLDGPKFEENLGLLLQWDKVRGLEERFEQMSGDTIGSITGGVRGARKHQARRMTDVRRIINESLYQQFGHERLDDERAIAAYRQLMAGLGDPELVVATTNYDRAVETALHRLGRRVETGFRSVSPDRTPVLDPAGLVEDRGDGTPVIHLHGAVGWYEIDGIVKKHPANERFNPSLGTPVVLYPDPDKNPLIEPSVMQLWAEFRVALQKADRVLVIGHSLHDPALVNVLAEIAEEKFVVATYVNDEGKAAIEAKLPGALSVQLEFGPKIKTKWPLKEVVRDVPRGWASAREREANAAA